MRLLAMKPAGLLFLILFLGALAVACGGGATAVSATPTVTSAPTAAPTPAATPDQEAVYIVKSGDTAWDIAQRFGITVAALAEANGRAEIEMDLLKIGESLKIPR
jgi:LysM repeat protein